MIRWIARTALVTTACWVSSSAAQSASDFKNAADKSGCGLIPY